MTFKSYLCKTKKQSYTSCWGECISYVILHLM